MKIIIVILFYLQTVLTLADPSKQISYFDNAQLDAFARLRVSAPVSLFNNKQLYAVDQIFWTQSNTGTGAQQTFDSNFSSVTLTSGTAATGYSANQTRTYWPYQPGRSQLATMTGNFLGGQANVIKRIGLFDDRNGMFFQLSGTALSVVLRSDTSGSVVDTIIPQASWNVDKGDGTGASGFNIDVTKAQIFIIDYQWLGVGRVRYGIAGVSGPLYLDYIQNTNTNIGVYMKRPNLPVRYEILNNNTPQGTAPNMIQICSSVVSEGAAEHPYDNKSVYQFVASSIAVGSTAPLVAIRLKSTFTRGSAVRPTSIWAYALATGSNGVAGLCLNCQISGGTWVSITNSAVEYNSTATSISTTNTASVTVHTDGLNGTSGLSGPFEVDRFLWGGYDFAQIVPDQWVLFVTNISGGTNTYLGGMNFEESK